MPSVLIKATPSPRLKKYVIVVDGRYIPMDTDNEEFAPVAGASGDGVEHYVNYTLFGPPNETLSFTVSYAGRELRSIQAARIFPGQTHAAGETGFFL